MISVGNNKAVICKGDFHPAQLYKGDKKIAGYTVEEFESENGVTLENCYNDKLHNTQIFGNSIQDGTPTPEAPVEVQSVGEYQTEGEYAGKYKIPVRARGKNLFDKNNVKNGFYTAQKGEAANTLMCCTNYFIPIKPNTEYTWTSFRGSLGYGTVFYDESKSSVSRQFISTLSFTTPDNVHYMKLNVYIQEKETFQLVEGVSLGNYESYIEPQTFNIYLDEPLRKVGDYADYVDFGKGVVVRNIKEVALKGGEIVYLHKGYTDTLGYWIYGTDKVYTDADINAFINDSKLGLSSHFIAETSSWSVVGNVGEWYINPVYRICFLLDPEFQASDGGGSTYNDINNWVTSQYENGTPVTLNYILATPIEEPIDLPKLPTFKGTTIIEVDTEIPATISGKYKKLEDEI